MKLHEVTIKMTFSRWDAAREHHLHHHCLPRGLSTGGGGSVVLRRRRGKHRRFFAFLLLISFSMVIQPCVGKGHIFKRRYRNREPITQAPRNKEADLSRYRPSNVRLIIVYEIMTE